MTITESGELLICRAAADLARTREEFSIEELIVRAWELFPEHFALKGFPDHPDSHKVRWRVDGGSKGMVHRGYLERVNGRLRPGPLLNYKLAMGNGETAADDPHHGDLGIARQLERLKRTAAYGHFEAGHKDRIRWSEAIEFIAPGGDFIAQRMARLDAIFQDRCTAELRALGACYDWLTSKFERQIEGAKALKAARTA